MRSCTFLMIRFLSPVLRSPPSVPQQLLHEWYSSEKWCKLCACPTSAMGIHIGEKDHQALEIFVDKIWQGDHMSWWAQHVYASVGLLRAPYASLYKVFDKFENQRLFVLHEAIKTLKEKKITRVTRTVRDGGGRTLFLVASRMSHMTSKILIGLLPNAASRELSAALNMITSEFSMETVYDILRLDLLYGDLGNRSPNILKAILGNCLDITSDYSRGLCHGRRALITPMIKELCYYVQWGIICEAIISRMQEYIARGQMVWVNELNYETRKNLLANKSTHRLAPVHESTSDMLKKRFETDLWKHDDLSGNVMM